MPAMAADWSGPYAGITGGYGTGDQSQQGGVLTLPAKGGSGGGGATSGSMSTGPISTAPIGSDFRRVTADGRYHLSGGLVGGAVGYNWQQGRFVYGIEGDGSWADVSGSGTCGFGSAAPHGCGGALRSLGTVRGSIGYDLAGFGLGGIGLGTRIFAAGGLAVGEVKAFDAFRGASGTGTLAGYTVGGGIEVLFSPHWSIRAEYLHVDLGTHPIFTAIPPNPERVSTTAEIVRVGISYHFNAPAAPVIAKY